MKRQTILLAFCLSAAALIGACSGTPQIITDGGPDGGNAGSNGSGSSNNGSGGGIPIGTGGEGAGTSTEKLSIKADGETTITVNLGSATPTLDLSSYVGKDLADAVWSVDRGNLASITLGQQSTVTLSPTGLAGGTLTVTATRGKQTAKLEVLIKLVGSSNGPNPSNPGQAAQIPGNVGDLKNGGGPGGVGGEGLGTEVTDADLRDKLASPTNDGAAKNLKIVYPYKNTVFPRGILAPLFAWEWSDGDADAIRFVLKTKSGSFSWTGTFGRPAILTTTGGKFTQHPIPEDIWQIATNSASGKADPLELSFTVAHGGTAYGALKTSFIIADARLSGTIYYNSYGTNLAKNAPDPAIGGDGKFGGATLSIRVGDTGPKLIAGSTTADSSGCRVCHSVAAFGSRLVTDRDEGARAAYDVTLGPAGAIAETGLDPAKMMFPAVYPDGSLVLTEDAKLYDLPNLAATLGEAPATSTTGLTSVASHLGTPMFSADGKKLAFTPWASSSLTKPRQKLVVMDFNKSTFTFSNETTIIDYGDEASDVRPGWPAFFPDSKSLVFQSQSTHGSESDKSDLRTRRGARSQIHWTNLTSSGDTVLHQLNGENSSGVSYLPELPTAVTLACDGDGDAVGGITNKHEDDSNMNYEPTVNPVAGGGYAWVVFTSRRRYANVATIPPFCSDPRGVDLFQNITPKKLWVAAVDLDAKPGEDASHPAFYLPGQELLAGNSRGFWVLDPCRADGGSCESGDQCCNGFCQPNEEGDLECGGKPPDYSCSETQEKCTSNADCCSTTNKCIGGFCSVIITK